MTPGPDGVLVVDKTEGPTSHDAVAVARRALATSRVGHTGTLDPTATGVLVLVVGRATRLARFLAHDVKEYEAEVTFGRATDTYDAQGTTTRDTGRAPTLEALEAALAVQRAAREQIPPAYSAKKVHGEAAHRAARRDAPVALPPAPVTVHQLTLRRYESGIAQLSLRVSAGYYVRSLAQDLGAALDTGAFLSALRRTRAGVFDLAGAVTFDALKAMPRGGAAGLLRPPEALLTDLPAAVLSPEGARRVRQGQTVQAEVTGGSDLGPAAGHDGVIRLLDDTGRLLGIARPAGPAGPAGASVSRGLALQPVVVLG